MQSSTAEWQKETGMDEETQELLREFIEHKNYFGAEALLTSKGMEESSKQGFLRLLELFGPAEQLKQARTLTSNPRALAAIDRLQKIQELLEDYGLEDYISYDLGMVSRYQYYTGVIFKGIYLRHRRLYCNRRAVRPLAGTVR